MIETARGSAQPRGESAIRVRARATDPHLDDIVHRDTRSSRALVAHAGVGLNPALRFDPPQLRVTAASVVDEA